MVDYTKRNRTSNAGARAAAVESDAAQYNQGLRQYMVNIYKNMSLGVGLTGVVAYLVAQSPELMNLFYNTPLKWVVMFAPLAFVMYFSFRVERMSVSGAQTAFWSFAALMGLSTAYIFAVYTTASIANAFFVTAGMFGAMSLYGYSTKKDLSGVGSFLIMGLIGIILASIVNIFTQSGMMSFVISVLSVIIFTGLTAYDTQRIKHMYYQLQGEALAKASIMGALSLYMDFINLMLTMLRFMGDRR